MAVRKIADGLSELFKRPEFAPPTQLAQLTRNWREVVGEELSALARPLGHRGSTLFIGCEDPIIMQELTFMVPDIIELVNAKLGKEVFDNVQLRLLTNTVPLDELKFASPDYIRPKPYVSPELGRLKSLLEQDSPLAKAYRAYAERHGKK